MDMPITRDTPALKPPEGMTSNFDNPYTLRPAQVAVCVVAIILSTFVITARLITRVASKYGLHLEDYFAVLGWLLLCLYCIYSTVLTNMGLGRHQWDVRLLDFIEILRLSNILQMFYPPMIFSAKLSILLQFLRIFSPHKSGSTYYATHVLIWGNLMFYTAIFFLVIFACTPREKIWNPTLPGKCVKLNAAFITTGSLNCFSDVLILLLPLRAIWVLQMPTSRKLQVSAVFATGTFACVASAVRLYYSVKVFRTTDANFVNTQAGLWSQGEALAVILCSALLIMPQFMRLSKDTFSRLSSGSFSVRSKSSKIYPASIQSKDSKNLDHSSSNESSQPPLPDLEANRSQLPRAKWELSKEDGGDGRILKTVEMETAREGNGHAG